MKKLLYSIVAMILVIMCACSSKSADSASAAGADSTTAATDTSKVLVAYFSATGITADVARRLADATSGTLLEIAPVERYTEADLDWHNKQSRSSVEMQDSTSRPAIVPDSVSMADYDVVLIGFPVWWDLAPREINTFIESHDLDGKTIYAFATSGGSTIANSALKLKEAYPMLSWGEGKLLNSPTDEEIQAWVATLR